MDNESKEQSNGSSEQPKQEGRMTTVKESTDLLKRLSAFNSKKEEVLKKIASISDRMEQRLGKPPTVGVKQEEAMPEFLKMRPPRGVSEKFEKFAYTRVRETQKPRFAEGCFNICMPDKKAVDDWSALAKGVPGSEFTVQDDGITLYPGASIKIPTGLKVALPKGMAFKFLSMPGLSVDSPALFIGPMHENELEITVTNRTVTDLKILFGIPLFTAVPVLLAINIGCEELLNSTYEDWVHGTING